MPYTIDAPEVADNIFVFTGTEVNWVIIRDGTELTLVDAGWAGDVHQVERTIRYLGRRPEDLRAVLLTHAHADHTGALNHLHDTYGVPIYMSAVEVSNAVGETSETGGPIDVVKRLYRPRVIRWAFQMVRVDGLRHVNVPAAQSFPEEGPLDLPGRPIPIATPGHTSGHTSYYLPGQAAVITGDALITAHPTVNGVRPRLLPSDFTHDQADAVSTLSILREVPADMFVPGHGPVWRGPMTDSVDEVIDHLRKEGHHR